MWYRHTAECASGIPELHEFGLWIDVRSLEKRPDIGAGMGKVDVRQTLAGEKNSQREIPDCKILSQDVV